MNDLSPKQSGLFNTHRAHRCAGLILLFLFVALISIADEIDIVHSNKLESTYTAIDGEFWEIMIERQKIIYVAGAVEGMISMGLQTDCAMSIGQIVSLIDAFYQIEKNKPALAVGVILSILKDDGTEYWNWMMSAGPE